MCSLSFSSPLGENILCNSCLASHINERDLCSFENEKGNNFLHCRSAAPVSYDCL